MGNYIYAAEDIFEPSSHLKTKYEELLRLGLPTNLAGEVEQFLSNNSGVFMYEGVVAPSSRPPSRSRNIGSLGITAPWNLTKSLVKLCQKEFQYRTTKLRFDSSIAGFIKPLGFNIVSRPFRAYRAKKLCAQSFLLHDDLSSITYAFFPLHPEPEVSLIVYSKPYRNQIEVVRLIASSLPVGMKLIVKEHPWQVGRRKVTYYKKLLDIPNVILAPPETLSRDLVVDADLITVIAGSSGFEGLLRKVPVIVLGGAPYNFLPSSMLRHVDSPNRLAFEIHDLLENYFYEEKAVKAYIGAVIGESVAVDFYSKILGRKNIFVPASASSKSKEKETLRQIALMAQYIFDRYQQIIRDLPAPRIDNKFATNQVAPDVKTDS